MLSPWFQPCLSPLNDHVDTRRKKSDVAEKAWHRAIHKRCSTSILKSSNHNRNRTPDTAVGWGIICPLFSSLCTHTLCMYLYYIISYYIILYQSVILCTYCLCITGCFDVFSGEINFRIPTDISTGTNRL